MTDPRIVIAARVARVRTRAGRRAYGLLRRAGYHLVTAGSGR